MCLLVASYPKIWIWDAFKICQMKVDTQKITHISNLHATMQNDMGSLNYRKPCHTRAYAIHDTYYMLNMYAIQMNIFVYVLSDVWDCKNLPTLSKDRGLTNSANVVLENYKFWRRLIYRSCCFTQLMLSQLSPLSFKSCSLQHLPRAWPCFTCSAGGIRWEMSQGVQACTAAAYKAYLLLCIAAGA